KDDDVFIEATPISKKVPVVNCEIVMIKNKPRYKIIRADDTHQLYTSFITLLKNFDREDLEDLWKIVKSRFSTSKPTNFSNDYLLVTLKTMFKKTDAQDIIIANLPPPNNDPNVLEDEHAPAPEHAPISPNPWIGRHDLNNNNGWIEEDDERIEEEDVEKFEGEDDEEMEDEEEEEIVSKDEAEIIYPYEEADPNNRPPPASNDESKFAPSIIPMFDVKNSAVPPVIHFSSTYKRGESSSAREILKDIGEDVISLDSAVRECQADVSKVISMMGNMSLEFDRVRMESRQALELVEWEAEARNAAMADDDVDDDDVKDDDDMDDDAAKPSDLHSSEPRGDPLANEKYWDDLNRMMLEELCPEEEISRIEDELRHLRVKDNDIASYTNQFNELVLLCPYVVPSTEKKIGQYIKGFPSYIKGETYSSKPTTLNEVEGGNKGNNQSNHNKYWGSYRDNRHHNQNNNRRNGGVRAMTQAKSENVNQGGHALKYNRGNVFHFGKCLVTCRNCEKRGHKAKNCHREGVVTSANIEPIKVCYKCGDANHLANSDLYPERKKQGGRNASGHVYAVRDVEQAQGPNMVTVSLDAIIVYGKKEVHIPVINQTLVVEGDSNPSWLKVISCIKARKYIEKGCHLFLSHITEKEKSEKRLKDVLVIRDFLEIFSDDLSGLPLPRQVKFKIDLVPGVAPIARTPYRLAPSKIKELSKQLKELLDKGFNLTLGSSESQQKLCGIHNTFHVSNLKKCLADENLVIPLKEIQLDDKLHFIEEPVEIIDREVKRLKQSRIPIVKILISRFNGESIIMGYFNVVRALEERMRSEFNINMAKSFNNFIMENDLVDVSLYGYQFTLVNSLATKIIKIDRFLILGGLLERFLDLAGTILDKGVPDHRHILLKEAKGDYGPIPIHFFHSWLSCDGFDELFVNSWSLPYKKNEQEEKHGLLQKIKYVESRAKIGNASTDELEVRHGYVKQLGESRSLKLCCTFDTNFARSSNLIVPEAPFPVKVKEILLEVPTEESSVQQLEISLNLEGRSFSSIGSELLKS
nr:reverse transcriptase domain-containing protein [Tanacetum cinerariifolium]